MMMLQRSVQGCLFKSLLLVTSLTSTSGTLKQFFIREPDNQTAIEGEQVTLPCRVENKIGVIQWTRDGFGLGDTRDLSGYSRYKLIGSDDEKDWTLRISPVLLEDDALFQCQVGAAENVAPIRSKNAQLSVYVPPADPFIVQGNAIEVTEDMEISLECVSAGGKPAADIFWHDGDNHVVSRNVRTQTHMLEDGKRFNTTSTIMFKPKKKHHNKEFTCSASNIADRSRRKVFILLTVRYAPSVSLTTSADETSGLISEGDTVHFKCSAHANPHPTQYTWYVDGARANGFESDYFVISNISQSYHNSIVKCEVRNEIGKSEETHTLQIKYAPKMVQQPESVSGDLGESVTLSCLVDSNPAPKYTWTKGDSRQAVGSSQNLTLIVSERTEGQYYCHSITDGYDLVSSNPAMIMMRRRPRMVGPEVQSGVPGDIVQVVCEAESAPTPTGVIWTFLGRTILTGNAKYEVITSMDGFKFQSTLIIRDTTSEDFGYYGCAVSNPLGSGESSIYLEKQEEFSMLLILIGIFATIIVILVITLMLLLCRSKLSQLCSHKEDKPYKPNNLNSITPPNMNNKSVLAEGEEEGWEDNDSQVYCHNRMSTYQPVEFQPKPDLINTEYSAAYSGGGGYESVAQSDSQTSLHSASQLQPNRHSTVLNVSDPRYSATYGNPYLRSPPKHPQYTTYSTFSPSDGQHPVSYITSPASTNTVHSMVSMPPPLPPSYPPHSSAGGSIIGVSIGSPSPSPHHRHPVSNDLYAVVSKPNGVMFRNGLSSNSPVPNYPPPPDASQIDAVAYSGEHVQNSHVNYIMDRDTISSNHTGTHV